MTAKEFLSQAYKLDMQIKSKTQLLVSLNEQAEKCTAVINGMPHGSDRSRSNMENAVGKIIDLQMRISDDLIRMIEVRDQISTVIQSIDDCTFRVILERRYLHSESWNTISDALAFNKRWILRLHAKALRAVEDRLRYRFPQYRAG